MLNNIMPEKENFLFTLDRALRRLGRAIFKQGAMSRVRLAAVGVLILGLVAGVFSAPHYWNLGASWIKNSLKISLPQMPERAFRLGLDLQGGTSLVYQADMSQIPAREERDALEGVRDVIERRVNAFGVAEPLIQTAVAGGNYRVIVELAGIKDVNQAIKQIGETPILEFKTQSNEPARQATPEEIRELGKYNTEAEARAKKIAAEAFSAAQDEKTFAELAKKYTEEPGGSERGGDLGWFSRQQMVSEFADPVFEKMKVGEVTKIPVTTEFGYHIIRKADERETEKDGKKIREVKAAHILIRTKDSKDIIPVEEWKGSGLTGKQLKRSSVQFDPQTGEPIVALQFDSEGAALFADLTGANINKPIAIFLDGKIISAPTVQSKIMGGEAVITGRFTIPEAKKLSQRLNAGALPVPISLISQRTVGATLGEASLEKSLFAGLLGFLLVVIFMIAFYRFPGILAALALTIYTAITLALFKLVGVTMTLAGIAGFILSIGMAVDANVLIFERIKEEIRRGKATGLSVDLGFQRAWNSIRDSNVSSLITCAILYWFGSSIVRGFALTLALGILVSMFSAISVTRTFMRLFMGEWAERHLWLFGAKRPKQTN
jgi:protein-export membrane protein SecD